MWFSHHENLLASALQPGSKLVTAAGHTASTVQKFFSQDSQRLIRVTVPSGPSC